MKRLLVILTILAGVPSMGQKFSSVISDTTIMNFILFDLQSNYLFPSPDSSEKKIKIYSRIYPWSEEEIQNPDNIINSAPQILEYKNIFEDLKQVMKIEISKDDQQYMIDQVKSINYDSKWEFPRNIKVRNRSGNFKNKITYFISVPIFSKDKSIVFLKRFMYCGTLCAEHAVFIYKRMNDNTYKIIHHTNYWLS